MKSISRVASGGVRLALTLCSLALAGCFYDDPPIDAPVAETTANPASTPTGSDAAASTSAGNPAGTTADTTAGTAGTGGTTAGTTSAGGTTSTGGTTAGTTSTGGTTVSTASVNVPPSVTGTAATTAVAGIRYSFAPSATDANNDTLVYSVQNLPVWAQFNTSTGQISGTPATTDLGSYAGIVISVSDGRAVTSLPAFRVDVMPTAGTGTVSLTWNPPLQNTDGSALVDLSGYVIHYGKDAAKLQYQQRVNNATQVLFVASGLDAGSWTFSISSLNSAGAESAPVTVAVAM